MFFGEVLTMKKDRKFDRNEGKVRPSKHEKDKRSAIKDSLELQDLDDDVEAEKIESFASYGWKQEKKDDD